MLQHTEIGHLFDSIRAMYGKAPSGRESEAAWAEALGSVNIEDLRRAWSMWKRSSDKPPTVAGLLRLVREVPRQEAAGLQQRPMCEPCGRDGGHRLRPDGMIHPPARSVVGPQDKLGPPEPMCSAHLEAYSRARYLERQAVASQRQDP